MLFYLFKVDWDKEQECFETFALETSDFYKFKKNWSPSISSQVYHNFMLTSCNLMITEHNEV